MDRVIPKVLSAVLNAFEVFVALGVEFGLVEVGMVETVLWTKVEVGVIEMDVTVDCVIADNETEFWVETGVLATEESTRVAFCPGNVRRGREIPFEAHESINTRK